MARIRQFDMAERGVVEPPVATTAAQENRSVQAYVAWAILGGCIVFFAWASHRGFDVTDDAVHLVWAKSPYVFPISLSQYGFFWHPIYLLVGGDITLFRIGGLCVLLVCGTAFALASDRFAAARPASGERRVLVLLPIVACVFWQYRQWTPSPGYNVLNLSAMMLFFTALMRSPERTSDARQPDLVATLGWAALAGVALGVIALTKMTSGVATACLGLIWLVLIPSRRPLASLAVAIGLAAATMLAGALLIDGAPALFLHRNLGAFQYMRALDKGSDLHGIATSVLHPFWPDTRWRIWPALLVGSVLFALAAEALEVGRIHRTPRWLPAAVIQAVILVLFGAVVAFSRALDPCCVVGGWPGYRAWNFPVLLVACAAGLVVLWNRNTLAPASLRRAVAASAVLAAVPFAYSIGTDITLLFHMSGASVFWAAAAMVLAAVDRETGSLAWTRTSAVLCCVATAAMLAGMSVNPGRMGLPLWQQTEPVAIGPDRASLLLDRGTAEYFRALQESAATNGFAPGTPVVDLSGEGPGAAFAIGGEALSIPWLLSDGPDPAAASRLALSHVPHDELSRAWVITSPERVAKAGLTLEPLDVPFPSGYRLLFVARQPELGWTQMLWRPTHGDHASERSGHRP
jgi:hypothetical protein